MTPTKIEELKSREALKFDVAIAIRAILEKARADYGDDWDEDCVEDAIISLVCDEDDE